MLLLACTNGHVSTDFIEIDTSDAQVVRRPGSKAFAGKNTCFISYIFEGLNGNGTRFSIQLGFNVPNILK